MTGTLTVGNNNDSFALLGAHRRLARTTNLCNIEPVHPQPRLKTKLDDDNQWFDDDAYNRVEMRYSAARPSRGSGKDFHGREGGTVRML